MGLYLPLHDQRHDERVGLVEALARTGRRGGLVAVTAVVLTVVAAAAWASAAPRRGRPDFVVTRVSRPPVSVAIGQRFTLSIQIANEGRRSAGSTRTRVFLSEDRKHNKGDVALTGTLPLHRLGAGRRVGAKVALRVPAGTKLGPYRVLVCADATSRVKERDERNNCRATKTRVVIRAAGSGSPTGAAGATVSVDADHDGFQASVDCNDRDPSIHPGARDLPDLSFVDSNCDGIDGDAARRALHEQLDGYDRHDEAHLPHRGGGRLRSGPGQRRDRSGGGQKLTAGCRRAAGGNRGRHRTPAAR